jgi:hypothetical protein
VARGLKLHLRRPRASRGSRRVSGGLEGVAPVVGALGPAPPGRGEVQLVGAELTQAAVHQLGQVDPAGGAGRLHGGALAAALGPSLLLSLLLDYSGPRRNDRSGAERASL